MAFTLPALPYAPAALEPNIDALTMQIHHDKHHQAYVDNLNKAVAGTPNENKSLDELVSKAGTLPVAIGITEGDIGTTVFSGRSSRLMPAENRPVNWPHPLMRILVLLMPSKKNLQRPAWAVLEVAGHGSWSRMVNY